MRTVQEAVVEAWVESGEVSEDLAEYLWEIYVDVVTEEPDLVG